MSQLPWSQLMQNAKEAPAETYDIIAPGTYDVVITKSEVTKTKTQGETMFKMQAKIETPGPVQNRIVFPTLIVPGPTADKKRSGYFLNDLKAFGISDAFLQSGPDAEQLNAQLINKNLTVQVTQDPDKLNPGQMRNNVKRLRARAGNGPTNAPAPGQAAPGPQMAPPPPQPVQFQPQQPQQPQQASQQPAQLPQQYAQQPQQQAPQQQYDNGGTFQPPQQQPQYAQQPVQQAETPQQPQQQPAQPGPFDQQAQQPAQQWPQEQAQPAQQPQQPNPEAQQTPPGLPASPFA